MNIRMGLGCALQRSLARLGAGIAVTTLLAGCPTTPDKIKELAELPTDLALGLAPAQTAPVLMTKPALVKASAAPTASPPVNIPLPDVISKACTAKYDGYVLFPITVCYPPFNLEELEVSSAKQSFAALGFGPGGKTGISAHDLTPKYFKLSSHPKIKRGPPWFCSVRSGPWYAHVEGEQLCGANPNIRSFTAQILGAPEPVVVFWSGAITDVPAPLQLIGVTDSGEECTCCSGVMCPDKSCKPKIDFCAVMPPAIK